MMKNKIIILLFLVISLTITGCTNKQNEINIKEKSEIEVSDRGVDLIIKDNTLSKTGAILILKNNNDFSVGYGNPFEIEIKKDGNWYKIDAELYFTLPLFYLEANSEVELPLNWEYGYGKLNPGTYRIIKGINIEKETTEYISVASEFTIE